MGSSRKGPLLRRRQRWTKAAAGRRWSAQDDHDEDESHQRQGGQPYTILWSMIMDHLGSSIGVVGALDVAVLVCCLECCC